jgi:O-antigen/teichoic acid export membrane protein
MNTSKELFESRLKKIYSLMFWLSFSIAILMTIFASPIIKTLFGNAYIESVIPLKIYIWAGISVFLGVVVSQYLVANNLSKISFLNTLLGALANIMLNILLIPKFGISGSAIATLISYTISTFSILFYKNSKNQGKLIFKSIYNHR